MGRLQGVTILQSAALAFFVTTALTVGIGFGLGTAAPLANMGKGSRDQREVWVRVQDPEDWKKIGALVPS